MSTLTRRPKLSSDRLFYPVVSVAAALAVFFGFARSWFLRPFLPGASDLPVLTPLLVVHGTVFTAWLLFCVLQPLLIGANRRDLHRTLGYGGAATAVLMVVLMSVTCLVAMREPHPGGFPTSGLFLSVNLALAIEFSVIIALAIRYRSRPDWHKRLILLSLVPLLPPGLARWPVVLGPPLFTCDLIIIAGCVYDAMSQRRIHTVWLVSLPLMIIIGIAAIAIGFAPAWQNFANWITTKTI
jgi:hypothetical protein